MRRSLRVRASLAAAVLAAFGAARLPAMSGAQDDVQKRIEELKLAEQKVEAERALLEARLDLWKARTIGAVPEGPYQGDVTLGEKAGQVESALLAVRALRTAAAGLLGRVKDALAGAKRIVLLPEDKAPSFDDLVAFRIQRDLAAQSLAEALSESKKVPEPGLTFKAPLLGELGAGLEAFDRLAGFFRSESEVGGVSVSLADSLLLKELLRGLRADSPSLELVTPSLYDPGAADRAIILEELKKAGQDRAKASEHARIHAMNLDLLRGEESALAADKARLERSRKAEPGAVASLDRRIRENEDARKAQAGVLRAFERAVAAYDALFDGLSSKAAGGAVPLASVVRQAVLEKRLHDDGAFLLLTRIDAAGGSLLTKRNLWTFFGGQPLWHMGGVSISYALYEGRGRFVGAGSIPVHGGFVRANGLKSLLESDAANASPGR